MVKGMNYTHDMFEVAPKPLISQQKPSNAPKLETIVEEGSYDTYDIIVHKGLLYLLPLFLSFASYLVIKKYAIN
ncbi:hypothetical protein LguiA_014782 [Lonicera macranthoides]